MSKLTIHGIYKDGIEYCSECNGMLTKIYDDFDERLWCENCKASTITVDYSQDSKMIRDQWLAKYPAFAYYANLPSPVVARSLDRTPAQTNFHDRFNDNRSAWADKWGRE